MANIKEQIKKLFDLARFDQEVRGMRQRAEDLPPLKEEIEGEWHAFKKGFEGKKGILASLESERRSEELDLKTSQESIQKRETRLFEIKTDKEYQSALKEVAQGKRENKELQESLLKMMGQIEEVTREVQELEEKSKVRETEVQTQLQGLLKEAEDLSQKMKEQDEVRQSILQGIDPALLKLYEKARKMRPDAVAMAESGTCRGCHMNIPPQLFNQILRQEAIYPCPRCHRILFLKEKDENDVAKA